MTISPPAKVKNKDFEPYEILASGFDSLYLSIDVHWADESLFEQLEELKGRAQEERMDVTGYITGNSNHQPWAFMMKPHGSGGYEWLINGRDMTLKIAKNLVPNSRPNVYAEIRSETLWHQGAGHAVANLINLLLDQGGRNVVVKPSRTDLCVDLLVPTDEWSINLTENVRTRADKITPHLSRKYRLTGISIGQGATQARIYDKPLEIKMKFNKKVWMYKVWKVSGVPDGFKIIRVEFQFRREALTKLNIATIDDMFGHCDNLWGYGTQKWLKLQTPGRHHTQRKDLPLWTAAQNGFLGSQEPTPAIRAAALKTDKEQLQRQLIGIATSLVALDMELGERGLFDMPTLHEAISMTIKSLDHDSRKFVEDIYKKRIMMQIKKQKWIDAEEKRASLHLPTTVHERDKEKDFVLPWYLPWN